MTDDPGGLVGRQAAGDIDHETALHLIAEGGITIEGRLVAASNATFYCTVALGDGTADGTALVGTAIYKPVRGEAPLWDFPDGTLAARERAAFLVSEASGWDVVPPTVLRDGPFGPGMVQLWVDADESIDPVALVNDADPRLRRIALFDAVVNNADRKVGHLLPRPDGLVQGVDHGVCFHREPKLRTVLWAWRGQSISADEAAVIARLRDALAGDLGRDLREHLTATEVRLTRRRADRLVETGRFPQPDPDRPAIPWPPY
ncbi:MAG: SCO1664 family protein [Chloroflexota bacterium]